jgi:heme-degrading monooxygenase HmoA
MIVEYTRYKISKERYKEFEAAYEKAQEQLKASSHSLQYEISHCVEDQDYYTLRIEWDSIDGHMKGFRTSQEFKPFFNDIQEMRHYDVTHIKGEKN